MQVLSNAKRVEFYGGKMECDAFLDHVGYKGVIKILESWSGFFCTDPASVRVVCDPPIYIPCSRSLFSHMDSKFIAYNKKCTKRVLDGTTSKCHSAPVHTEAIFLYQTF